MRAMGIEFVIYFEILDNDHEKCGRLTSSNFISFYIVVRSVVHTQNAENENKLFFRDK